MTILLYILQGIFILSALSWFFMFVSGYTGRIKALASSFAMIAGASASFITMEWWPLAVGFGIVVLVGFMTKSTQNGNREIAHLHALHEIGTTAEKRVETATRMLDLALKESSPSAQHQALHKALDVLLNEGKFFELSVDDSLHQRYWELGHQIATEILKYQQLLNIDQVWFAKNYIDAKSILVGYKK